MKNAPVVEVVIFKLNHATKREEFLEYASITQDKVKLFDGFVDRQLLEGNEGQWIDLVWWQSLEAAQNAAELIMQDPDCMPFMQAIDPDTMQMMHLHPATLTESI